jgi:radical SAM superfamily enzyme YgiQ (UPF0313 family)
VTLVASSPKNEILDFYFPNLGVRRIEAALCESSDLDVHVVDDLDRDLARTLAEIVRFEPEIVGFSTYIWSLPHHHRLLSELCRVLPECVFVMGGPCAHPAIFELSPYRDSAGRLRAVVLGEGEQTFVDLAALAPNAELASVAGLALPQPLDARSLSRRGLVRFQETAKRPAVDNRDRLASPYQRGVAPRGGIAYLQRFYGCPLSCTYCEWGLGDDPRNVHSREYLVRELEAFAALDCQGTMVVDAGLNMNARAFENLRSAELDVGFLKGKPFFTEAYPSQVTRETLEFLAHLEDAHVGVGLQSYDPEVLRRLDRVFEPKRFEQVVHELAAVCSVTVEVILGLPGDDPESFRRTVERVRRLPVGVRVYHCVALPTGLMTRSPEHFELSFDPLTLKVRGCWGWPEVELERTADWLTEVAERERGIAFDYWWGYGGPEHRGNGDIAASLGAFG